MNNCSSYFAFCLKQAETQKIRPGEQFLQLRESAWTNFYRKATAHEQNLGKLESWNECEFCTDQKKKQKPAI